MREARTFQATAQGSSKFMTANRLWLIIFGLWGCFLSGAFASLLGGPGVIQALRLQSLLKTKTAQIRGIESQISQMDGELVRLEKNRVEQEREIRRTLGYVASDEIIFEFAGPDRPRGDAVRWHED